MLPEIQLERKKIKNKFLNCEKKKSRKNITQLKMDKIEAGRGGKKPISYKVGPLCIHAIEAKPEGWAGPRCGRSIIPERWNCMRKALNNLFTK